MSMPDAEALKQAEGIAQQIVLDWQVERDPKQSLHRSVKGRWLLVDKIKSALLRVQQAQRDTIERLREALIRLREELPRLLMPSECGGSLRQCERIIDTALSQGEAGGKA